MIDVLAVGRLLKAPEQRIGKTGKAYAVASLAVAMEGDDSVICSVIAFRESAAQALAALDAGDARAVAGKAKVTAGTNRDGETKAGLSIVADHVLSAYHVRRKRRAVQGDDAGGDDFVGAHAGSRSRHSEAARSPQRHPRAARDSPDRAAHRRSAGRSAVGHRRVSGPLDSDLLPLSIAPRTSRRLTRLRFAVALIGKEVGRLEVSTRLQGRCGVHKVTAWRDVVAAVGLAGPSTPAKASITGAEPIVEHRMRYPKRGLPASAGRPRRDPRPPRRDG